MNKFSKIGIGVGIAFAVWLIVGFLINLVDDTDTTSFDDNSSKSIHKIVFYTDKTQYKIGEPITITMKNESDEIFSTPSVPIGFSIIDDNGDRICTWIGVYEAIGNFEPQQNVTKIWGQKYCDTYTPIESGTQVSSGTYTIIGDHFYDYPKPYLKLEIQIID